MNDLRFKNIYDSTQPDVDFNKLDINYNSIFFHVDKSWLICSGYMAPEYALWGFLSDKADVYSFGVLALEIVSGKNNTGYIPRDDCICLLDWVPDNSFVQLNLQAPE